ncbi:MAG: CBS domain-containing protein [Methylohalobius sp.]|nr:CBS domain-containing protein [Methylohalobius sp.]
MTVGEVCSREVVIISSNESVLVAAKLMRQYHVGDLVVVEEREGKRVPVGILTDRDIVVKILAQELDPPHLRVSEVMSAEIETIGENDEVFFAADRMRASGVRRLPVIGHDGGLVGIVTLDDLIDLLAEELRLLATVATRQQRREPHRI